MKRHEFKEVSISNFLKKINNQNNLLFKNMCGEIQRKIDTAECQNIKDVGDDNHCDLPYSMHAFYGS